MPKPVAPPHGRSCFTFGPFRLDPVNRLLLHDGVAQPLTAKVFDLLLYFVENGGRLLTKDEILSHVWPDAFVEEGNLARHVSMLRKVLLEGPKDHTYVVTVPGRGYRFVAHVSHVTDHDFRNPATLRAVEPVATLSPRSWGVAQWVAPVLIAIAVVGAAAAYSMRPRSPIIRVQPELTLAWRTTTGDVYGPAISRDGAYLAYCWLTPGGYQGLRVRQVAGGDTIDVVAPAAVDYWSVRFSPKGEFIYYVIGRGASNPAVTLYRVPTLGGRSERMLEHVSGIALSPDGNTLALIRAMSPGSMAIMAISTAGGEPRTLVTLDGPAVVQSLDWAPDRAALLYAVRLRRAGDEDIWQVAELPLDGGKPKVVVPARTTKIIAAAWLPQHRGILMSAIDPASGLPQIWHVDYPNGVERRLTDDLHTYKDLTVTADGTEVVTQSLGRLVQLWVGPGDHPGQAKPIASGTTSGAFDGLAWTDNHQLLYKWAERGFHDIWRMAPDGSGRRQVTADARDVYDTATTRDGRYVVFISSRSGSRQIWRMGAAGDDLRQLTHVKSSLSYPIPAADGKWIYFAADQRGVPTLWRMSMDGGSIAEVSPQPIELFDLSPNGHWLAYSYRDAERHCLRVRVVPLAGAEPVRTYDIEPTYAMRWTPDGQGLAFTHEQGNLWIQPLNGGAPHPVTQPQPGFKVVTFAWSPGAASLAFTLMATPVDAIAFRLQ